MRLEKLRRKFIEANLELVRRGIGALHVRERERDFAV